MYAVVNEAGEPEPLCFARDGIDTAIYVERERAEEVRGRLAEEFDNPHLVVYRVEAERVETPQ